MKRFLKILIVCSVLALFMLPASASESAEEYFSRFDGVLPEEYRGITDDDKRLDSMIGPGAVMSEIVGIVSGASSAVFAFLSMLLCAVALIAVCSAREGVLYDSAAQGISVLLAAAVGVKVVPIFIEVSEVLSEMSRIFAGFIPIASAVQVSSGAVRQAAVSSVGMNVTVSVISSFGTPFFLTLAGFGVSMGLFSGISDGAHKELSASVRSFFMWCVGIVCAIIMGTLSLQTYIASARDSAAMRAAKYAAASMIPVVGGTVSGAIATLATGLSYVKSVVGTAAVAVMLSLFLSPLIILLLYRCALSVAAGISGYLGVGMAQRLLSSVRGAFDLYIAVYAISGVIYIFEIVLFMMSANMGSV